VDVRIGVTYSSKELELAMADDSDPDALREQIEKAVSSGDMLWLTDRRGRQIGIPVDKLAYVDVGSPELSRRIGFGG
jgi:hypothetical protein